MRSLLPSQNSADLLRRPGSIPLRRCQLAALLMAFPASDTSKVH